MPRAGSAAWSRYALAAIVASPLCLAAQVAPLPDTQALLRDIRQHLRFDAMGSYTYVQREIEVKLDGEGKPTGTSSRVYEIYPATPGLGPYKRLISRDGVPLPADELRRNDRSHEADVRARAEQLRAETSTERERRAREAVAEQREREAQIDDVFRVCAFRVIGRESLAGRSSLVVAFSARPGVDATTRYGGIARHLAGKAWVDEADREVVRVEARAVDDLTYGFGLFARVHQGTSVWWERRKVNDETWVPARLDVRASARVLLFKKLGLHLITDYFDYRRFSGYPAASLEAVR